MAERFISIGTIIIDDIVLPDGAKKMGILGGGLTHAAMGMRVWSENVGLVSGVGADFKGDFMALLETYFDVRGLGVYEDEPTPRAWQRFDADGTRNEFFQTDFEKMKDLIPEPEALPKAYSPLTGVHLHCPPEDVIRWVSELREKGCDNILWEPWDDFCVPENEKLFGENSAKVDIVSPNLREGRLLTGLNDPEEVVIRLKEYGAPIAILRMAEDGSLIADKKGNLHWLPSYPVEDIVDVTGAGNAYCGGFIIGYYRTGDVKEAGWYGGVSASMALHQFGALYPLGDIQQRAKKRLAWYQNQESGDSR